MNKKIILILLALIIICCICFCALGIVFYFFYSEDIFSNNLPELNQIEATEIVVVPTQKPAPTTDERIIYLNELADDLSACSNALNVWKTINDRFAEDKSLLNNTEAVEEYQITLLQMKEDCTSLGVEENLPAAYEELNNELLLVNENAVVFIDNFLIYLETQDEIFGEAGLIGLTEVNVHLEKASNLAQVLKSTE
ncbi:MAG: hypothetical protein JEZ00_06655 [Anaerolineaceae bacterium]|nr:hypothetical protein [Anaerolineaceae bacterium]